MAFFFWLTTNKDTWKWLFYNYVYTLLLLLLHVGMFSWKLYNFCNCAFCVWICVYLVNIVVFGVWFNSASRNKYVCFVVV